MTLAPEAPAGAPEVLPETKPVVQSGLLRRRLLDMVAPDRPATVPLPPPRSNNPWELRLLALAALAVYAVVGYYLLHYLHFVVGDALARTANAKYMLFSRKPHFAALGFVWGPIPTVSQLPAMAILNPFGHAIDSLWVTSSLWGAGTVLVLGKLGRDLGLPRVSTLLLVAAYAFNPVVVYYAANGMSEGPFFFFAALTFLGLLRYLRRGDTQALILTGCGVGGCALDRYEAIPLLFLLVATVLLADLRRGGRRTAVLNAVLVAVPAIGGEALWFIYMRVIKGSFTAFITDAGGQAGTAGLPKLSPVPTSASGVRGLDFVNGTSYDALHYSLHFVANFAPALVLMPLLLIPPLRRSLAAVCLMIFTIWEPLVNFYYVYHGDSAANPRYFVAVIPCCAIGAIFLAARTNWRLLRIPIHLALVCAVGVGGYTGYRAELDKKADRNEAEWQAFQVLNGTVDRIDTHALASTQAEAGALDAILKPGDRVFTDDRFSFLLNLDSKKSGQWIINNDSDYDAISAAPYRPSIRIDYLVTSGEVRDGSQDYADIVHNLAPSIWTKLDLPGHYTVYKRVPGSLGPANAGVVSGPGETLPVQTH